METREEILKELRELAPKLAELPKMNLYQAPNGYFESFGAGMKVLVAEATAPVAPGQLESVLSALKDKKGTDTAPAGYFNTFSASLLQKIRVSEQAEELSVIAPALAKLPKVNYLQAPVNYFNSFPALMLKKVKQAEAVQQPAMPTWLITVNNVFEQLTAWVTRPRYAYAFAGGFTMVLLAVMVTMKAPEVQPASNCTDLACLMNEMKINDADLDGYFRTHADEFNSTMLDNFSDDKKMQKVMDKKQETPKGIEDLSDEELNFML